MVLGAANDLLVKIMESAQTQISAIRQDVAALGTIEKPAVFSKNISSIDTSLERLNTDLVHFQKVAGYMRQYSAILQVQANAPLRFVLPEPQDDAMRTALAAFLAEMEKATGEPLIYTTEPFITKPTH